MTGWDEHVAVARAAFEAGDPRGAEAAAGWARAVANNPAQAATAQRLIGDARVLAGDRDGARTALAEALHLAAPLPARHPVPALIRNSLGILEKFCGNLAEAAAHYEAALEADLPGAEFRAGLLHNLGGLAHSRRDLASAETYTREALALHTGLHGAVSPGACADLGQLASIVAGLGRHDEALELIAEAIVGFTELYGPEHVEVGIARCTLGAALDRAGRLDEAEAAYRAGLAIRAAALGPDHPDLAPTLLNLGRILDRRGDRVAGRALALRAVGVLEGKVVAEHRFLVKARRRAAEAG